MRSNYPVRSYFPALDGLRGIAILAVILYHNFDFTSYFRFGWVGVDLFFVLSGFLITDILLKTKEDKNFLRNFYVRRVLRIFPLYYMILLLYFIFIPFLNQLNVQYNYYYNNQSMLWLHLQNWLYIFNQKPDNSMLLNHFWSLSVEEQFYLLWPFAILAVKTNQRLIRFVLAVLSACVLLRFLSWSYFGNGYTNFHFQSMTRIDGLCIGSLIAIWRSGDIKTYKAKIFRLSFILLSVHAFLFLLSKTFLKGIPNFPFLGYTSIAVIFGITVVYAIENKNSWIKIFLENRILKGLGKISYGLYVYHWPIMALLKLYLLNKIISLGWTPYYSHVFISLAATTIAIVVSKLSYEYFEKRILALKDVMTAEGFFTRLRQKTILLFKPKFAK